MKNILEGIKNIIFDFGGVVFEINPQLSVDAFKKLGFIHIGETYAQLEKDNLFNQLQKGEISDDEFRNKIRQKTNLKLTDKQIDDAWCKMLIRYPEKNIELLKSIKNKYRIFLLSNTSNIHCTFFTNKLKTGFNLTFEEIFEKKYFSHQMGLLKPDKEIYLKLISENNLIPKETLFIDDTIENINGADNVGLQTFFLTNNKTILTIFGYH